MAKEWPLPTGNFRRDSGRPNTYPMSDDRLARELDIGVNKAHDMIEDLDEQHKADNGEEDE